MSQNTLVIADGTGAQVLERMNNSNNTLATLNSGSSAPATTYAHMLWADTTNNQLKMRNAANTGWNIVGSFDATSFYASVADASITEAKIATGAVTANKIGALAVTDAKLASNSVTTAKILDANVTPAKLSQPLTVGTSVAPSGTSVTFTDIPSWVRKINVVFYNISTSGTSPIQLQIGNSNGIVTSNYFGSWDTFTTTISTTLMSSGFVVTGQTAGQLYNGIASLYYITKTTGAFVNQYWAFSSVGGITNGTANSLSGGSGSLETNDLNQLRITTVNGTDLFDGGRVNIIFE